MVTENARLAEQLLRGWTSGDFASARATLADDVEFVGPLGKTSGADKYIDGVSGFARFIDFAELITTVSDGDNVVLIYELVTKTGKRVPTAGHYRVQDGKVRSVRAYFDPTPLKS